LKAVSGFAVPDIREDIMLRRFVPLTIALALVAGTALADESPELVPDEQTFYLHWDGCGADSHTYLSILEPEGLNGCGFIGGIPLNTPFALLEEPIIENFTTEDGIPVQLDGSGTIDGEVAIHSWTGITGAGAGVVVIEGELRGLAGGQFVTFGTFEDELVATPGDDYVAAEFSFDVPEELDEATLSSLSLDVSVWGVFIDSGVHATGGLSYLTVPTLVEAEGDEDGEVVEVDEGEAG
jgi:hypothetical protein